MTFTLGELLDHNARLLLVCRSCARQTYPPLVLWRQERGDGAAVFDIVRRLRCKACGIPFDAFLVFDPLPAERAHARGEPPKIVPGRRL